MKLLWLGLSALLATGCAPLVRAGGAALAWNLERHGLEHAFAAVDGARVEYWAGGEGPPLVLLHGFGPSAPWAWARQVDAFDEHFRMLVPNLLWFGDSVDPRRDFGLDRQVEVVAGVMDALGFRDAAVVGASYGGLVAYRLAFVRPDLVGRLVMIDSPGAAFSRSDYDALLARHGVDDAVDLFVPRSGEGIERLIALSYWDEPPVPDPLDAAAADVMYDAHRDEKSALLRSLASNIEQWSGHRAPRQPTLVIWGRHDTVFPLEAGRRLARTLGADLAVIPDARHAPHVEHDERVNALLLDWLRTRDPERTPSSNR